MQGDYGKGKRPLFPPLFPEGFYSDGFIGLGHRRLALREALTDLDFCDLTENMLQNIDKEQRKLSDQFAYCYNTPAGRHGEQTNKICITCHGRRCCIDASH